MIINGLTYVAAEEAAKSLGMTADDLWLLTLEGDQPAHITKDGMVLYLEEDIERIGSTVRS